MLVLNHNGIRDDIDAYIDSLSDTVEQKAAMTQVAFAVNNTMLIDVNDHNALVNALKLIGASSRCIRSKYDSKNTRKRNYELEKFTVNTKARLNAYDAFSSAVSGMSSVFPRGDSCAIKRTVNTKVRFYSYNAFNSAVSGMTILIE